jgi:prolyl-tRNA synthetase
MLDAYSFDRDADSAVQSYHHVNDLYLKILGHLGLDPVAAEQSETGDIGGSMSHELVVKSPHGESRIGYKADGSVVIIEGESTPSDVLQVEQGVEVGHNFHLGTKYSKAMNAYVDCEDGVRRPADMGCYGIGVSRLIAVLADIALKDGKLCWPPGLEPYKICIIPLCEDSDYIDKLKNELDAIYKDEVVVDGRALSLGQRLGDAEVVGIPVRIVIGKQEILENTVTIKHSNTSKTLPRSEMTSYLNQTIISR